MTRHSLLVLFLQVCWGGFLCLQTAVLSIFWPLVIFDSIRHLLYSALVDLVEALRVDLAGKYALVTGCSSGFGLDISIQLARRGCLVFANVRSKQGATALQKELEAAGVDKSVTIFVFDVVDDVGVQECKEKIEKILDGKPLWAVINNAGVSVETWAEGIPMSEYRRVMEVNVAAVFSVSKTFLPLLRRDLKQPGRIINISSVAGRIADRKFSCYSASKFALEGLSDSLRREMMYFGVEVVNLNPSYFKTKMVQQLNDDGEATFKKLPLEIQSVYEVQEKKRNRGLDFFRHHLIEDSSYAVKDIVRCVYAKWPVARAYVGLQAWFLLRFGADLPGPLADWWAYLGYR
eukprot:TRINITY_DN2061_c0_g1_i2.p1 TRINITY_DN2061_c0_g1~~TRINITY_DN2061_c0_g1_i2.p1  ORF type:complete len:347 (-),score=87.94 TRINITY_DN2061_c0_g1_i2:1-1041(-)